MRAKIRLSDDDKNDSDSWVKITADRQLLSHEIVKWQQRYFALTPQFYNIDPDGIASDEGPTNVEDATLCLPSDFDASDRVAQGLHSLASVELDLRKGEAYDAIREVRASASHVAGLKTQKKRHVRGVRNTTRAGSIITTATRHLEYSAQYYNRSRAAILSLDPSLDQAFPELTERDYKIKGLEKGVFLGTGTITEGWIWGFGPRSDESMEPWQEDGASKFIFVQRRYLLIAPSS